MITRREWARRIAYAVAWRFSERKLFIARDVHQALGCGPGVPITLIYSHLRAMVQRRQLFSYTHNRYGKRPPSPVQRVAFLAESAARVERTRKRKASLVARRRAKKREQLAARTTLLGQRYRAYHEAKRLEIAKLAAARL